MAPKKRPEIVRRVCPEGQRYGRYCLGRVIGAEVRVRRLRCPHDGELIEVLVIKGMRAQARDSDLRPHLGRFGQRNYIWICPRSNYAALVEDFQKPYERLAMERALRAIRRGFQAGEEIPGTFRYQAAAAGYVARKKDAKFFGQFYLRAAWAAREENNKPAASNFRKQSIAAMQFALKKKLYPLSKRPTVAYLIAELYRQEGKFYRASMWFERAWEWISIAEKKNPRQKGTGLRNLILLGRSKAAKRDDKVFVIPGMGSVKGKRGKKKPPRR
ncbi:MAG: DUF2225 domain-containing protein [Myxococcales bacterium]|nr:DUF2225 domain-containing protein [Myxococcales bacterium]